MQPAVAVSDLVKRYPRALGYRDLVPFGRRAQYTTALAGVTLEVGEGECFGVLGPNGAGKTTLMKILSTLVLPTSGRVSVLGHDIVTEDVEVRKLVGLISADERSFYWRLTGRQNLEFFASLYHLRGSQAQRRIDELLELLDLTGAADQRFQTFSTGMRQKMAIARGLLSAPRVLLVDEPTRSLDHGSALAVRKFLREMVSTQGCTVVLATHQMSEAEQLCDRVSIIHHGRIAACGTVRELSSAYHRETYRLEVANLGVAQWQEIACIRGVTDLRKTGQRNGAAEVEVATDNSRAVLPQVIAAIISAGGEIHACNRHQATLEEVFTGLIGGARGSEQSESARKKVASAVGEEA